MPSIEEATERLKQQMMQSGSNQIPVQYIKPIEQVGLDEKTAQLHRQLQQSSPSEIDPTHLKLGVPVDNINALQNVIESNGVQESNLLVHTFESKEAAAEHIQHLANLEKLSNRRELAARGLSQESVEEIDKEIREHNNYYRVTLRAKTSEATQ